VSIAFVIVAAFGLPSFEDTIEIWRRWAECGAMHPVNDLATPDNRMWALPGAFTALPWTMSEAVSLSFSLSLSQIVAWILVFLALGTATVQTGALVVHSLCTHSSIKDSPVVPEKAYSRVAYRRFFLVPLAASAPLFIVGWDFGRWFSMLCISYVMVTLSENIIFDAGHLECSTQTGASSHKPSARSSGGNKRAWCRLLLLLLAALTLRLPVARIDWYKIFSEPFGSIVHDWLH